MMARLGFIFQSVSIAVVFLAALACASGDTTDEITGTGGTMTGTGGTGGQSGTTTNTGSGGTAVGDDTTIVPPPEEGPVCGNNLKEDGEICDGTDLAGTSCDTLAAGDTGTLSCSADCLNFDTSLCYTPPPAQPEAGQDDGGYGM